MVITAGHEPRIKRPLVWFVVLALLIPAIAFGAVWGWYKKPWLMDDYRSGYAAGTQVSGQTADANDSDQRCAELMGSKYGIAPKYQQYVTPEPASAFWWGCIHGAGGADNDWWNVSGYLTA
jgi:hypothetical protein